MAGLPRSRKVGVSRLKLPNGLVQVEVGIGILEPTKSKRMPTIGKCQGRVDSCCESLRITRFHMPSLLGDGDQVIGTIGPKTDHRQCLRHCQQTGEVFPFQKWGAKINVGRGVERERVRDESDKVSISLHAEFPNLLHQPIPLLTFSQKNPMKIRVMLEDLGERRSGKMVSFAVVQS